ncbi:helix-turn-helix domain-containing protein [Simiaoa sunii]|uniref:helix-turn-helix domain-containing protein n=5 Tax=Clostridia TaxID=186801 RepID=UPI002016338D|nr:helix-turn-helix transcriptional regulator [Simiaoa sunii]
MPIDDLTALGQKMREARKNKELTQQELSDLSHVSVKQIANIEKGKMNPSYLILRALAKVLHISLDTLINPDVSLEDEGVNQMKMLYSSCPPEMRDTLLHHTQETVKELTYLSEKFEMKRGKQAPLNTEFHSVAARSPFHSGRH